MSKKTDAVEHTGPTEYFPFDNYEQFEKAMDEIIILLNTLSANRTHDEELDIIEGYIIQHFGQTEHTAGKIREILVTLEAVALAEQENALSR
jgi:hypothetical protein